MRKKFSFVAAIICAMGIAGEAAAKDNSPQAPLPAPSQTSSEGATKIRTLGVCMPVQNTPGSAGDGSISPIASAQTYFYSFEHQRYAEGSATVKVLEQAKHGIVRLLTEADRGILFDRSAGEINPADASYIYLPDEGYLGKDSASLLVDFGEGLKVKVIYYIQSVDQFTGGNEWESQFCSKTGANWKISSAPLDAKASPPLVNDADEATSLKGRQIAERVISPVFPGKSSEKPFIVSPDGLHVAYVAGFGAETEAEYGGIGDDGWKQHFLIVDGKKGKYDSVTNFQYSPDGKHTAFMVETNNDGNAGTLNFFVVDGIEGERYVVGAGPIRYLSDPKFSPDSSHFAYQISASAAVGPDYIVVDGKKGKEYANISRYSFSPDGQRLAYIVGNGASRQLDVRGFVVVDRQEGKRYEGVSAPNSRGAAPVFSPDSKRVAFIAENNASGKREEFVVVDGVEHHAATSVGGISDIVFSPDSQHFLYQSGSLSAQQQSVIVDGTDVKQYNAWAIFDAQFSPDSKRIAYVVKSDIRGGETYVVVDGQAGKHYSGKDVWVHGLTFSPDSKLVAFYVQDGATSFVVVDGNEYAGGSSEVTFSPDGSRWAYVASKVMGKRYLVLDGNDGKPYDLIVDPVFSADGKSFAYAAYTRNGNKWRVVVNGHEGKAYDLVLCKGNVDTSSLHFEGSDKFRYLAVRDKKIFLVEEKLSATKSQ